jgi:2-polyprenyl-3-methyl-5-hydroxy-6-metoxy-1,4-benzoquinol methylase
MNKPKNSIIDQPWPEADLEDVNTCPYCGSEQRTLAYKEVQDWSFYCAPGKWSYWDCKECEALYLSPRPTKDSIGLAYKRYYTHTNLSNLSVSTLLKLVIKNECWSHLLNVSIKPRLWLPKFMRRLLSPISSRLALPYDIVELARLPKGRLIDVGCGSGALVDLASQLGWDALGLELDSSAVKVGHAKGLNIIEGSYEKLTEYPNEFDCIICSHVLEHVHDPLSLLNMLVKSLKANGTLLLSLPNAASYLRKYFGENWRGLEAPRHITLPTSSFLIKKLIELGFNVKQTNVYNNPTELPSLKIHSDRKSLHLTNVLEAPIPSRPTNNYHDDFIQLTCTLNSHSPNEI